MKINIIKTFQNSHKAEGLAVAIDVLRAFSVVCFIAANNAEKIIPVAGLEHTYRLKKKNPDFILIGERGVRNLRDLILVILLLKWKRLIFPGKRLFIQQLAVHRLFIALRMLGK